MVQAPFWHLDRPESTANRAEWVDEEMDLETVICPVTDGHQRAGRRLTDLSVALPRGRVEDFVWTWYSECLLQDHVLELFRRNGFTGFEVKPVKAKFKRTSAQEPPRLFELIVTGWAGMASAESGINLVERCEACGHTVYSGINNPGAVIDVSQWDGSDFFIVWPLPRFVFVTNRVAQVIRENRLSGFALKQPRDLVFSGTVGGGRLSYWMPENRARELGAALGIY